MYTEVVDRVTIRPLRNGETAVVQAVFDRLGDRSRHLRFGGAKNVLTARDLELLARVDGDHHVLVALIECEPIGIARLVRDGADGRSGGRSRGRMAGPPGRDDPDGSPRCRCTRRRASSGCMRSSPRRTPPSRALMRHAAVRVSLA